MTKVLFAFLLFISALSTAQLETSKWYFGGNAGLDFTTSPPTVISNTNLNTAGGMSSMSDANGNLLFYTDGITVWNKQHQVMANGTGLITDQVSTQNVVIMPDMIQAKLYHIWTVNPLQRTTVDMSLAAGLGSVTAKNYTMSNFSSTGTQITASSGCGSAWLGNRNKVNYNGHSYWQNSNGASGWNFYLSQIPVNTYNDLWLKFSSCGRAAIVSEWTAGGSGMYYVALGYAGNNLGFGYANFFSELFSGNSLGDLFSCEFSPDGSKFYVSSPGTHNIYQWDLCAGSDSAVKSSLYIINTGSTSVYGLQLAPDGRLYGASNPSLSVINFPDLAGAACGFTAQQQSIGTASFGLALPNFSSHYFGKQLGPVSAGHVVDSVGCKTATFNVFSPSSFSNCASSAESVSAVKWNFGDPLSGAANTSTLSNPIHFFSGPGTFPVQVIIERGCRKDTIIQQVGIPGPWPVFTLSGDMTICTNESTTITASGTDSYSWTGNNTGSVFVVSPTVSTTYTVTGKNTSSGCEAKSTFSITVLPCVSIKENESTTCKLYVFQDRDNLMISLTSSQNFSVHDHCRGLSIRDLSGRTVLYEEPDWNEGNAIVDITNIPAGIYILWVESCSDVMPVRFVLNR